MKVTQWFMPNEKPVRTGVYEVEGFPAPYLIWTGETWRGAAQHPSEYLYPNGTMRETCPAEYAVGRRWRGLAEKPK